MHGLCPGKALLSWALPMSQCALSWSCSWICSPGTQGGPDEGPPTVGDAFCLGMLQRCAGRVCSKTCNLFQLHKGLFGTDSVTVRSEHAKNRYPGKAP